MPVLLVAQHSPLTFDTELSVYPALHEHDVFAVDPAVE